MFRIAKSIPPLSAIGFTLVALAPAPPIAAPNERGQAGSGPPPAARKIAIRGVENLYQVSGRIYSGAQPEGPVGFEALKNLGIKTILSVDGARPDVEEARHSGMVYIHLPVGYDGIDQQQSLRIARAVASSPGPVFIHCHHGKHRGPTATALACQATEGWSRDRATSWLKQAGTSADYRGLYESVLRFEVPEPKALAEVPGDFPATARVPAIVDAMVGIDECWDLLTASKTAAFAPPPGHPDIDPAHEALLLTERFHELLRTEPKRHGPDFEPLLLGAERASRRLESALRSLHDRPEPARREADQAFQTVARACASCHERYRNRRDRSVGQAVPLPEH